MEENIIPHFNYLYQFINKIVQDNGNYKPDDDKIKNVLYKILVDRKMIEMVVKDRILTRDEGVNLLLAHLQSTFRNNDGRMMSVDCWGDQNKVEEMKHLFFGTSN